MGNANTQVHVVPFGGEYKNTLVHEDQIAKSIHGVSEEVWIESNSEIAFAYNFLQDKYNEGQRICFNVYLLPVTSKYFNLEVNLKVLGTFGVEYSGTLSIAVSKTVLASILIKSGITL